MSVARRQLAMGAVAGMTLVAAVGSTTHFSMGELGANRWKALVALVAFGLSRLDTRRPASDRTRRVVAGTLAVLAIGAYYNFGNPVYDGLFHRNNVYHHYLGTKYERELGYTRLYRCTAVAEAELGLEGEVRARRVRDLETDGIVLGATMLEQPERCKSYFGSARWVAFREDVRWFRGTADRDYWDGVQLDHGYNGPPVWTAMAHVLTSLHATSRPFILFLASLDVFLCAGAFAAIAWAFGWRLGALAIIFWGCQDPANHLWVSGSLLRHDWFFFLVVSVCFAKKRWLFASGAMIAAAIMLRIFPVVTLAGPASVIGWRLWRDRRLFAAHARFIKGAVLAGVLLTGASAMIVGPRAYTAFADHIRVHEGVPAANNMGVAAILMNDFGFDKEARPDPSRTDPLASWRDSRMARLRLLRPLHAIILLAMGGVFFYLSRGRAIWIAQALSVVVVFSALRLASYYLEILLLPVLLARVHRPVERLTLFTVGIAALAVTMPALSGNDETEFLTQSIIYFAFLVALLASLWPKKLRTG